MQSITMEAQIDHGRVIPNEPEKLPLTGTALLTVLTATGHKPDWDKIMSLLGTMQNKVDGLSVERQARADWNGDENLQPPRRSGLMRWLLDTNVIIDLSRQASMI